MTEVPTTRRWVATRSSARRAATTWLKTDLLRPRFWVIVAIGNLVIGGLLASSYDGDRYTLATRAVAGLFYALIGTAIVLPLFFGLIYLATIRRLRVRFHEGAEFEGRVDERSLYLRGPLAENVLSFDGFKWVRTSGRWLFFRQHGSAVVTVWPADAFYPEELARLKRSVGSR